MAFGSPYTDKYPDYIENTLRKGRKGKDCLAGFYRFVNKTKIYDHVLKYTPRYFAFSVVGGCVCTFFIGTAVDNVWKRVNKGRLYVDLPREFGTKEEEE